MEEKTLLKRSSKGLQVQLVSVGTFTILLGLFSTWMINVLLGWTTNQGFYLKLAVWVLLILGWAYGSLRLWFDWQVKRYEIGQNALIVHAKAGKWGSQQAVYRYESIISIRMTQNVLGKHYGYGDVFISMPKLDYDVVLNDIEHPVEQIKQIQSRMSDHSEGSHALIN